MFQVEYSDLGALGPAKNWIALGILALVLVGIASERIHRMWCAMIGAGFMVSRGCCGCGRGQLKADGGCRAVCAALLMGRSAPSFVAQMGLLLWMNMVPSLALVVEWLDESTLGALRCAALRRRGAGSVRPCCCPRCCPRCRTLPTCRTVSSSAWQPRLQPCCSA